MNKMISVIQAYIHIRTGKEINMLPPRNGQEVLLVNIMYTKAMNWFNDGTTFEILNPKQN